jgi:HK97 gp10 family phage protein
MISIDMDFRHIMDTLDKLPESLRKDMLDDATKKAGRLVRDAAYRRAPRGRTGNLKKGLTVSAPRVKSRLLSVVRVRPNRRGPHWHLVEFGHKIWRPKKAEKGQPTRKAVTPKGFRTVGVGMEDTGRRTKRIPMLRPAFLTSRNKVLKLMLDELSAERIEKKVLARIRRTAKKAFIGPTRGRRR